MCSLDYSLKFIQLISALFLLQISKFPCSEVRDYSCGRKCGRKLDCGNHTCSKECHLVTNAPDTVQVLKMVKKCDLFQNTGCEILKIHCLLLRSMVDADLLNNSGRCNYICTCFISWPYVCYHKFISPQIITCIGIFSRIITSLKQINLF